MQFDWDAVVLIINHEDCAIWEIPRRHADGAMTSDE